MFNRARQLVADVREAFAQVTDSARKVVNRLADLVAELAVDAINLAEHVFNAAVAVAFGPKL